MINIRVGDEWVDVPDDYIHAEGAYCRSVADALYASIARGDDVATVITPLRNIVNKKRKEFYEKFLAGEVKVSDNE